MSPRALLFVSLSLAAGHVSAVEKQFPLDNGATMTMNAPVDWEAGARIQEWPFGTLTLHGADPAQWRVTLVPLPPHPTLTGDAGNLQIYVRNMARGIENTGATLDGDHKPISGAQTRGYYFRVHYPATKPKRMIRLQGGDYAEGFTGAVSIGTQPYLFEVLWNKGGESVANSALAAIKTIRIK